MKTYIIYNKEITYSEKIANECLDSFDNYIGWDPELYQGCSPITLALYEKRYNIKDNNPLNNITKRNWKYETKKSCFYSHYSLWKKSADTNESITILEHDTECVGSRNFDNVDGILELTKESVLKSNTYQGRTFPQDLNLLKEKGDGIFPSHSSHTINGYKCISGNTGYYISSEAAKILVKECEKWGWLQNDLIMTTKLFPIYYIVPSPIKYIENKEIRSSTFWRKNEPTN